jgi:hypothetical protein
MQSIFCRKSKGISRVKIDTLRKKIPLVAKDLPEIFRWRVLDVASVSTFELEDHTEVVFVARNEESKGRLWVCH